MSKEEKQLLLKDLCARLSYGVMVEYKNSKTQDSKIAKTTGIWNISHKDVIFAEVMLYEKHNVEDGFYFPIEGIKPYLRPLSSMTEEEKNELSTVLNYEFYVDDDFALVAEDDRHRIRLELCEGYIGWLNAHHFDYRGLIEKGLALEAKEGMYKTE